MRDEFHNVLTDGRIPQAYDYHRTRTLALLIELETLVRFPSNVTRYERNRLTWLTEGERLTEKPVEDGHLLLSRGAVRTWPL